MVPKSLILFTQIHLLLIINLVFVNEVARCVEKVIILHLKIFKHNL